VTDHDDLDGAVARHLTRTLKEVAATTPISDRRDAIASRLPPAGAEPVAAETPSGRAEHRAAGHRRIITALAVAAVVLVVVALAAVAIRRGDDGAVDLRPVEDPAPDTGWYLPGDGWTVTIATAERRAERCPCTTALISETGDDPAALTVMELAGATDVDFAGSEAIDVGGRRGTLRPPAVEEVVMPALEPDETEDYAVEVGDRRLFAVSRHVDQEVVIAILDAWADRTDAGEPVRREDLPLPEGMEATVPQTKTWAFDHDVLVGATNDATGDTISYKLAPTGSYFTQEAVLDSDRTTFAGDVFTVESDGTGPSQLFFITHMGGPVDISAGFGFLGEPVPDPETVTALAESLHEVSTADWRAALEPVDPAVDAVLLSAPTLFDPPLTG